MEIDDARLTKWTASLFVFDSIVDLVAKVQRSRFFFNWKKKKKNRHKHVRLVQCKDNVSSTTPKNIIQVSLSFSLSATIRCRVYKDY